MSSPPQCGHPKLASRPWPTRDNRLCSGVALTALSRTADGLALASTAGVVSTLSPRWNAAEPFASATASSWNARERCDASKRRMPTSQVANASESISGLPHRQAAACQIATELTIRAKRKLKAIVYLIAGDVLANSPT